MPAEYRFWQFFSRFIFCRHFQNQFLVSIFSLLLFCFRRWCLFFFLSSFFKSIFILGKFTVWPVNWRSSIGLLWSFINFWCRTVLFSFEVIQFLSLFLLFFPAFHHIEHDIRFFSAFLNSLHDSLCNSALISRSSAAVKNANGIHYLCICRLIVNPRNWTVCECVWMARHRTRIYVFDRSVFFHTIAAFDLSSAIADAAAAAAATTLCRNAIVLMVSL